MRGLIISVRVLFMENIMQEIRCKNCGRLLGKFDGAGEIKCPKIDCRMINEFDTKTGTHRVVKPPGTVPLKDRRTSSSVTFE